MNLMPTKLRNSINTVYPSSSNYFLSFVGEVLRFVLSRVFYSAFLPEQSKITCTEKRLISARPAEVIRTKNRYSLRDSRNGIGSVGFSLLAPKSSPDKFNLSRSSLVFFGPQDINYCLLAGSLTELRLN